MLSAERRLRGCQGRVDHVYPCDNIDDRKRTRQAPYIGKDYQPHGTADESPLGVSAREDLATFDRCCDWQHELVTNLLVRMTVPSIESHRGTSGVGAEVDDNGRGRLLSWYQSDGYGKTGAADHRCSDSHSSSLPGG